MLCSIRLCFIHLCSAKIIYGKDWCASPAIFNFNYGKNINNSNIILQLLLLLITTTTITTTIRIRIIITKIIITIYSSST